MKVQSYFNNSTLFLLLFYSFGVLHLFFFKSSNIIFVYYLKWDLFMYLPFIFPPKHSVLPALFIEYFNFSLPSLYTNALRNINVLLETTFYSTDVFICYYGCTRLLLKLFSALTFYNQKNSRVVVRTVITGARPNMAPNSGAW